MAAYSKQAHGNSPPKKKKQKSKKSESKTHLSPRLQGERFFLALLGPLAKKKKKGKSGGGVRQRRVPNRLYVLQKEGHLDSAAESIKESGIPLSKRMHDPPFFSLFFFVSMFFVKVVSPGVCRRGFDRAGHVDAPNRYQPRCRTAQTGLEEFEWLCGDLDTRSHNRLVQGFLVKGLFLQGFFAFCFSFSFWLCLLTVSTSFEGFGLDSLRQYCTLCARPNHL